MNPQEARLEALRLAMVNSDGMTPDQIAERAETFHRFLMRDVLAPGRPPVRDMNNKFATDWKTA